jgi:hypothetical protein
LALFGCEFVLFREGDDHLAALAVWRLTRRLSVNQTSFLDPRRRSLARELFRLGRTSLGVQAELRHSGNTL